MGESSAVPEGDFGSPGPQGKAKGKKKRKVKWREKGRNFPDSAAPGRAARLSPSVETAVTFPLCTGM